MKKLRYEEETGIPVNLVAGEKIFLFEAWTGVQHDCVVVGYTRVAGLRALVVKEKSGVLTYRDEEIASVVYQSGYAPLEG